jgi:hypothetical protein
VQSWRAFAVAWRGLVLVAAATSAAVFLESSLDRETNMYESAWIFLYMAWISSAIQSLAFAPMALKVLDPTRRESIASLDYWARAARIGAAAIILQTSACWPMAAAITFVTTQEQVLLGYGVFLINAVIVGALFYILVPVYLMERRTLWDSAHHCIRQIIPHIWRMMALSALYWLIYLAVGTLVALVASMIGVGETDWLYYALWWPIGTLLLLVGNVTSAVSYQLLRIEREGPDPLHVAGLFE